MRFSKLLHILCDDYSETLYRKRLYSNNRDLTFLLGVGVVMVIQYDTVVFCSLEHVLIFLFDLIRIYSND